jgi:hypothetical protein
MLFGDHRDQALHVIEKFFEMVDVTPLARRATVPLLIMGINGKATPCKPAGHLFVTATMLTEAMNQDQHSFGMGGHPRAQKKLPAPTPIEVTFYAPKIVSLHAETPPIDRFRHPTH